MATALSLPTEIYFEIFSYLSVYDKVRARLVYSYWKYVLNDKKFWLQLSFAYGAGERVALTDRALYAFFRKYTQLLSCCRVVICHELNGDGLVLAAERSCKLKNLKSLNLSFTNLSDIVIYKLLSLLPNLRYLDLGGVSGITDVSTLSVSRLKHLRFLRCSAINITPNTILLMTNIAKFLKLQEVDIRCIPLPTGMYKKLIDTFKVLRTLKLLSLILQVSGNLFLLWIPSVLVTHKACCFYAYVMRKITSPKK